MGERRFIHAPATGGVVELVDMRARCSHTGYGGARQVVFELARCQSERQLAYANTTKQRTSMLSRKGAFGGVCG